TRRFGWHPAASAFDDSACPAGLDRNGCRATINRMARKSVTREAKDIVLASNMVRLGARLQVLQAETSLSYDRLTRLYKEIRGCSPPKGMLPFSVDWFMTWLPNIHASLFYSIY